MIVLTTSAAAQTLKVIPREYESEFTFSYRDDSTNVTTSTVISNAITQGNYLVFNYAFNPVLVLNHFYDVELYSDYAFWNTNYSLWENFNEVWNDTSNFKVVAYRDKIFCTDQTISQTDGDYYDLNKGQYVTTEAYNNEYIVT
tara:strand:+ start:11008 stop:11436 length:429 start_codon:yes stop_codon:yes gene_type:complete